jgi:hypothetical protein
MAHDNRKDTDFDIHLSGTRQFRCFPEKTCSDSVPLPESREWLLR